MLEPRRRRLHLSADQKTASHPVSLSLHQIGDVFASAIVVVISTIGWHRVGTYIGADDRLRSTSVLKGGRCLRCPDDSMTSKVMVPTILCVSECFCTIRVSEASKVANDHPRWCEKMHNACSSGLLLQLSPTTRYEPLRIVGGDGTATSE